MQTRKPFFWLTLALFGAALTPPEPPQVELSNGLVRAVVYLPDAQNGYYRGTRFDWAGAFRSLENKGHQYVEQWFPSYDPNLHDAINGPAEEFVALGYNEAKPGETFVKIGVGVLRRPDDKPYFFAQNYDIVNGGKRSVKSKKNQAEFTHELTDDTGYGYRYTKTLRLVEGKPELLLEHRLTNTGRKPIETSVYNHNFWIIDKEPTGPGVEIAFPYAIQAEGKGFGEIIKPQDKRLVYNRQLTKGENVYSGNVQGYGPTAESYDIRIENKKTGAGLRATADQPLEKLVFWACATTSCPEPYIRLKAAPGQTAAWTIRYEFYQKPN